MSLKKRERPSPFICELQTSGSSVVFGFFHTIKNKRDDSSLSEACLTLVLGRETCLSSHHAGVNCVSKESSSRTVIVLLCLCIHTHLHSLVILEQTLEGAQLYIVKDATSTTTMSMRH